MAPIFAPPRAAASAALDPARRHGSGPPPSPASHGFSHSRAQTTSALLLNRRGGRLSVRGASGIIAGIATAAGLDDEAITAHVGRHTFATTLIRGGTDLVLVTEMLGHARLDTARAYTKARELHQVRKKPQVTRSTWPWSVVLDRSVAAV